MVTRVRIPLGSFLPPRALIVCPLEIEARRVRAALGDRAEVIVGGLGPRSAETLRAWVSRHGAPDAVVLAGVCGALRAPIGGASHEGRAVRVDRVVSRDGERWECPLVGSGGDAQDESTLVGVDELIATAAAKRALATQTGAAWVDMESHHFARACESLGLRWGVARGVSDDVDRELPEWIIRSIRPDGSARLGYSIMQALRRPWQVRALLHIVHTTNAAADAAGRAGAAMLDAARGAPATAVPIGPAPVPGDARVVVIVGGTFDPPHIGHVALPREAARAIGADWRLYVPAARSPHKQGGPVASDEDRVEMLRLALAGEKRASIAMLEIERARGSAADAPPSYTIDTLRELRNTLGPGVRLGLFLGADQAAEFHRWKEPREVIALSAPVVALREPFTTPDALLRAMAPHWSEAELAMWRAWIVPTELVRASATAARAGDPDCLAPSVERFIRESGLYRSSGDAAGRRSTLSPRQ